MPVMDRYVAAERSKDEQARARLVGIALLHVHAWNGELDPQERDLERYEARERAGFKNPSTGSWCAAGLTAAMEDAGLVVPAPGTPARRGAVALLDFVIVNGLRVVTPPPPHDPLLTFSDAQPGDIIAWLQHPPGKDPAGWRRGHVALIVAVESWRIGTVGWNEGPSPGRVEMRWLVRDPAKQPPSKTVLYRRPGGLYGIARPVAR